MIRIEKITRPDRPCLKRESCLAGNSLQLGTLPEESTWLQTLKTTKVLLLSEAYMLLSLEV